jgi:hypothetical protein
MISPPPRSHHALVQIPDFQFSSLRPTSSRSAPPCTPAYDRQLPSLNEEKEPIDSTELDVEKISKNLNQVASLGSLDSTALLSHTDEERMKIRLNPNASGSLDSVVTKIGLRETENMSMLNHDRTFSEENLLSKRDCRNNRAASHKQNDKIAIDSNRLLLPATAGAVRGLQSLRQQVKPVSAESLSPYSKGKASLCRPANFPEVLNTGIINLMVFGGLSKRGIESSDRSIDMWKCNINPGNIIVSDNN